MGRKKRDYVERHKQSLGEVIENPETYGVRVRRMQHVLTGRATAKAAAA
jgi:hypothetical protein